MPRLVHSSTLLLLLIAPFSLCTSIPTIPLPTPPGGTNVHITTFPLTDHSRRDPYAPTNTPRRIMVSLFQPATCKHPTRTPYMPPATAASFDAELQPLGIPNGTFEAFHLQTCPSPSPEQYPLALFSPGLGNSRLSYNIILQWISSLGFTIISIDHPYDTSIVEFPDGSIIHGLNISVPDGITKDLDVRVADASFVLDAMSSPSIITSQAHCVPSVPRLNTQKTAYFGHSLGGATAAQALLSDRRFVGGLDMDGSIFGRAVHTREDQPFVLFASAVHQQANDESWASFWQALKGWKLQLQVNATKHLSFTDYPALVKTIGIDPAEVPEIGDLIGTIDGMRMLDVLRAYVGAFLESVLSGKNEGLLEGPSKAFPDVMIRNASGLGG